jgi:hypothetical protein
LHLARPFRLWHISCPRIACSRAWWHNRGPATPLCGGHPPPWNSPQLGEEDELRRTAPPSGAAWASRRTIEDLRALMLLYYNHLNPYGTFVLDLNARLALAHPAMEGAA